MKKLFNGILANGNQAITIHQAIAQDSYIKELILYKKLVYKISIYKIKNYMEVDNKYSSNEFDTIAAKKSRKDMVDTWFNKKLNKPEAKISQSTY